MLRVLLIVAVVVLIAIILAGVALIRDYWRPLKDSNGQPVELDSKQKSRLKIMMGAISPVEEGILDKALIDVYSLKGITMEMVDPSKLP